MWTLQEDRHSDTVNDSCCAFNCNRKDGKKLGQYLRVIAEELNRAADCLEEKVDDMIDFFDEVNRKVCRDYKRCNSHNGILNGS